MHKNINLSQDIIFLLLFGINATVSHFKILPLQPKKEKYRKSVLLTNLKRIIMIKKFLFSLVVVLTTFLFATSANAREIASITRTPVMEIPAITANPTSPKQVYVRETLVVIEYTDGSMDIYYERVEITIDD